MKPAKLKPLLQYTPEEWLKLTQAQQVERYNDCVHHMRILMGQLTTVMEHVKDVRKRLECDDCQEKT